MTKRLALLAFLLLPALPARAQDAATTTMRSAAAAPGAQAPALRLVAAQRLPRSPVGERPDFCRHLFTEARSPAGRQVIAAGWAVTVTGVAMAKVRATQAVSSSMVFLRIEIQERGRNKLRSFQREKRDDNTVFCCDAKT